MHKLDIIKSYYEPKLQKNLPDYAILGWESREAQYARFDAFLSHCPVAGKSLLDLGCGLGDILDYLKEQKVSLKYTGVDILPPMVEKAQKKHPESDFHCYDVFKTHPFQSENFDVLYASGIFNLDLGNNKDFLKSALTEFFRISRECVAFNLLHKNSPDKEEGYFYFCPEKVVKILEELPFKIESIQIIEEYLQNDFTVICHKKQTKN